MKITLAGMGMGGPDGMTLAVRRAVLEADAVVGSTRLLESLPPECRAERVAEALPERVAAAIEAHPEWKAVCVALSGDVGFYSGAKRLAELLARHNPELLCGVSTPQYFAARLRRPWQDIRLVSAHGVACDPVAEALNHPQALFLTGGDATPAGIIRELVDAGLGDAMVTVGENLSYPDERIVAGSAAELAGQRFAALSAVLVENRRTFARDGHCGGIEDDAFIRGSAPMTKREARAAILSLLAPKSDAVLYDIGSGTGSVAVEMALAARRGRVYAVEREAEAHGLLLANRERFGVYNLRAVHGAAPDAMRDLPRPDAVFVGGSKGRMRDIFAAVLEKNPDARLVASAISLETLSAALAAFESLKIDNVEATQISAARTVLRGGYHMLSALNPVFLLAGGGPRA